MISYSGDAGFLKSALFAFYPVYQVMFTPLFSGQPCVFSPWFGRLTGCRQYKIVIVRLSPQ